MLTALIGPVTGLLDKFIEDKDQKARLAHDIATMSEKHANALAKEQAKANTEAAKHPSMFVAGARPAIMWVCYWFVCKLFYTTTYDLVHSLVCTRNKHAKLCGHR